MKKHWYKILFAGAGAAALLVAALGAGLFSSYRQQLLDRLYTSQPADERIVVVALDEATIQQVGQWPLPRSVYAELLGRIYADQPRAVGLDVVFTEYSTAAEDSVLAATATRYPDLIFPVEIGLRFNTQSGRYEMQSKKLPFPELRSVASPAFVTTPLDYDTVFRRVPLAVWDAATQQNYAPLGLTLARKIRGENFPLPTTNARQEMLVNFSSTPGKIISAATVLRNAVPANTFTDRLVLIGATAQNLHDEQATPLSRNKLMPGVFIHANILSTLLNDRALRALSPFVLVLLLLGLAALVTLLVIILRPLKALAGVLLLGILYVLTNIILFDQGIVGDILFGSTTLLLVYVATATTHWWLDHQEKAWIQNAFGHYLSPDIIAQLLANPALLKLGGEQKTLTIMFSDIRGFTALSEKLSPEKLISLLNRYLSGASALITQQRGTIDKYIGDAIMAFWGAPLDDPQQAVNCCQAVLAVQKFVREFPSPETGPLRTGFGVNTGPVVVGNVGSENRFDYTVIGDSVNLASRLEGLCKVYGVTAIIGEETYQLVKNKFVFRLLDRVTVKGKKAPTPIYELLAAGQTAPAWVEIFQRAQKFYFAGEWIQAEKLFRQVLAAQPTDGPSQLLLARCAEFSAAPPSDWQGVYEMTTK